MRYSLRKYFETPSPDEALLGRAERVPVPEKHFILGTPLTGPWPEDARMAQFGMGCFWGAEKFMWQLEGVYSTFVGYSGGYMPNPTYEEVLTERTGHNEVAMVIYRPELVPYERLLKEFWENHDPTQGMRQGNDIGTRYRSAIYTYGDDQMATATKSLERYQEILAARGFSHITTEVIPSDEFYYAEEHHQQYLAKFPWGYCNHGYCQARYE